MSRARFTSAKYLTIIWVILIVLTLATASVGFMEVPGVYIVALVLLSIFLKGQLIIDHFMGLRNVRGFWRHAMLGFVTVIPAIIFTGYYLSSV